VVPEGIKAAAMAVVVAEAHHAEDVRRYAEAFDIAFVNARIDPSLPCPRCFVVGVVSALQPLAHAGALSAMRCVRCGETLESRNTG
jgi:hypothetical protein